MASATDDAAAPAPTTTPGAPSADSTTVDAAHAPAASEATSTLKAAPAEAPKAASTPAPAPAAKPSAPSPATSGNGSSSRKKAGFMSKLKGVLLSCVGPNAAHPPEEPVSIPPSAPPAAATPAAPAAEEKTEPAPAAPAPKTQEASEATVAPPAAPEPHHGPDSLDAGVEAVTNPSTPVLSAAALIAPSASVAANDEEDVVVPPAQPATLPEDETAGVTSGAVVPPGASAESSLLHAHDHSRRATHATAGEESETSEADAGTDDDEDDGDVEMREHDEEEDDEDRLIMNGGAGIPIGPDGVPRPLLPPVAPQHLGRKCLVLDLDETLLHSSFKAISQADFIVPVEIEYHWHNVYVIKRPGVDQFLKKMGEIYEIVIFTASLSKYADPVLDKLDIHRVCTHRLFRESCYNHRGTSYVKDLSQLGRPIADTIILDNSPASYIFHPNNAVPVSSWFNDPHDTELTDLVPFLTDLATVDDVRGVLDGGL